MKQEIKDEAGSKLAEQFDDDLEIKELEARLKALSAGPLLLYAN